MNNDELNEWIDQYLEGSLPDIERQELEHRMAIDADFRAEVNLHRAMHTSLGEAGNVRLRASLDRLLLNPPNLEAPPAHVPSPSPTSAPNWFRLTGIIAVLIFVGLVLWRWYASNSETRINQPKSIQGQDTITSPLKPVDTASIPVKENRNRDIAMVDPKSLLPNPMLETKIGDMVRGGSISFELTSPGSGTTFQLQNGQISLLIQGISRGGEITDNQPLALLIYSNRPEDWTQNKPIKTFLMPLTLIEDGSYRVDFRPKLRVGPGLYYLVVGQKRLPEVGDGYTPLWIDKFIVRATQ